MFTRTATTDGPAIYIVSIRQLLSWLEVEDSFTTNHWLHEKLKTSVFSLTWNFGSGLIAKQTDHTPSPYAFNLKIYLSVRKSGWVGICIPAQSLYLRLYRAVLVAQFIGCILSWANGLSKLFLILPFVLRLRPPHFGFLERYRCCCISSLEQIVEIVMCMCESLYLSCHRYSGIMSLNNQWTLKNLNSH